MISVIGDGSLTGGMAYEALNNAAEMKTNFIIVLNDNHMSISKNVGGMSSYLGELRTAQAYTDLKDTVENVLGSIPFGGILSAPRAASSSFWFRECSLKIWESSI